VFGEEVRDDVVGRLVGRVVEVGVVEAGVERVAWGAAAVALEGVVAVVVRHFFCVCVCLSCVVRLWLYLVAVKVAEMCRAGGDR
jgi:hypothetical protein